MRSCEGCKNYCTWSENPDSDFRFFEMTESGWRVPGRVLVSIANEQCQGELDVTVPAIDMVDGRPEMSETETVSAPVCLHPALFNPETALSGYENPPRTT